MGNTNHAMLSILKLSTCDTAATKNSPTNLVCRVHTTSPYFIELLVRRIIRKLVHTGFFLLTMAFVARHTYTLSGQRSCLERHSFKNFVFSLCKSSAYFREPRVGRLDAVAPLITQIKLVLTCALHNFELFAIRVAGNYRFGKS